MAKAIEIDNLDLDGPSVEMEKNGTEVIIGMDLSNVGGDIHLWATIDIEELKNTIRMLEECE